MIRQLLLIGLAVIPSLAIGQIPRGISGTWEGTSKVASAGQNSNSFALVMILRQDGDTISGSVGPSADHQLLMISNGKLISNRFSFELGNGDAQMSIAGELTGQQAKGDFRTINKQSVAFAGTGAGSVQATQMTFHFTATRNDGTSFSGELQFQKIAQ